MEVRGRAAWALGAVGQGEAEVVRTLHSLVQDRSENKRMRWAAAMALGQVGQGEEVVKALLRVADEADLHAAALAALWDVLARGVDGR